MRTKYFAHRDADGFDSKQERQRYMDLCLLEGHGVNCLHCHWRFSILPPIFGLRTKQLKTKVKSIKFTIEQEKHYTPDFLYFDDNNNVYVMEEVKSFATKLARDYPIRRHLIKLIIERHNAKGHGQWIFKEII